jgi:hypothetical protein
MSVLQLYRGPRFEMRYTRRLGSPFSVIFLMDGQVVQSAGPCDFIELKKWLEREAAALSAFMTEPEDTKAAENMRGDTPGET